MDLMLGPVRNPDAPERWNDVGWLWASTFTRGGVDSCWTMGLKEPRSEHPGGGHRVDTVVILNWRLWSGRGLLLGELMKSLTVAEQALEIDWLGSAEDAMTVSGVEYWSQHVAELSDVLSQPPVRQRMRPDTNAMGICPDGTARLTMSVEEAAATLGISRAFAYEAVHRGEIPHIRIGRRVLIPRAALDRLVSPDDSGSGIN